MNDTCSAVVLVEGESDRQAVAAIAAALGRDLGADGVVVVAMGGATNVERCADQYRREAPDRELVGLCDVGELRFFQRVLDRNAIFVCESDLEDELIRAFGHEEMIRFIEEQGELKAFRSFQKQPAQRDRSLDEHLHRFFGTQGGRKVRYAREIAALLAPDRIPAPLSLLLAHL
jgi:hypothetical protein